MKHPLPLDLLLEGFSLSLVGLVEEVSASFFFFLKGFPPFVPILLAGLFLPVLAKGRFKALKLKLWLSMVNPIGTV